MDTRYYSFQATQEHSSSNSFFYAASSVFLSCTTIPLSIQMNFYIPFPITHILLQLLFPFSASQIVIWRKKWQPTPVLFPGEFYGQRSLEGYNGVASVRHDLATKQKNKSFCKTIMKQLPPHKFVQSRCQYIHFPSTDNITNAHSKF